MLTNIGQNLNSIQQSLLLHRRKAVLMAFSSEPTRSSAYDEDLRWKMVWQRVALGKKLTEVARNLCVGVSTVHRIVQQFETTGAVSKKPYSTAGRPSKLSTPIQLTLLHLVLEKPGIYLWEIKQELKLLFDLDVSTSMLCTFLAKSGFSRKRIQHVALQRDEENRNTFMNEVALYKREFLIFR